VKNKASAAAAAAAAARGGGCNDLDVVAAGLCQQQHR